jgi:hypothetical protein
MASTGPHSAGKVRVVFELRHQDSAKLIRDYRTEGAALAFIRDVVRVGGRVQAAQFILEERREDGQVRTVATGDSLVRRALEDRAE